MEFLLRLVTWWNGTTLGTQLFTARKGVMVGKDSQGNTYYQSKDTKTRWVIYNGEVEASRVPPEWHGWLHHSWDETPNSMAIVKKFWEKPHQENLTGMIGAYAPPGSLRAKVRAKNSDYESWSP